MPHSEEILIVLIAGIGDLVLASKAIRSIRCGHPSAEIHLLTSSDAAPLAKNYRCIDRVWAFPIREFRKDKRYAVEILRLIGALRKIDFRVMMNLYTVDSLLGAMKMGLLFSSLHCPVKAGHDSKGFGLFLTKKIPERAFRDRHIAQAMLEIALSAGGVSDGRGIEVCWGTASEATWKGLLDQRNAPDSRIVIGVNPGGDRQNRRWSPDCYADVADRLIDDHDARVILLGGPTDKGIAGRIEGRMRNRPENLSGQLNLDELTYVIGQLDLLVTNDSGPMHIAAALGVPLVAVFGPEDPNRLGPFTEADRFRVLCSTVPCHPCEKAECENPVCLESIYPGDVYEACVSLLARAGSKKGANMPAPTDRFESAEGK
jgi:heptosyltransferase II